jgi:UvrD-like helicase C-terminal domain
VASSPRDNVRVAISSGGTIRRFKGMEREVVVLVELPTEGDRLDELMYVGFTRATTELVVIAPPELARRLA